ncbi:hypothetical protein GCK72_015980 [Caenorhabditis remanei]|uniref:Uncharacterized protein n=1 Tax=Caenorhabditis remanei TaxID=31234 RepID=A0A6A5GYP1_CAERE|nr:hypothetical protein GCK72_015980 [Caenorhabditis remanei]KAF1759513.1 hypothetical protein GCK72_015980 [Caenorhabditis remanei]
MEFLLSMELRFEHFHFFGEFSCLVESLSNAVQLDSGTFRCHFSAHKLTILCLHLRHLRIHQNPTTHRIVMFPLHRQLLLQRFFRLTESLTDVSLRFECRRDLTNSFVLLGEPTVAFRLIGCSAV